VCNQNQARPNGLKCDGCSRNPLGPRNCVDCNKRIEKKKGSKCASCEKKAAKANKAAKQ
jgi:hypothetical protein